MSNLDTNTAQEPTLRDFTVTLTRDVTESVNITVQAEDEDAAAAVAIETIANMEDPPEWELDDYPSSSEAYCTAIEELNTEPVEWFTVWVADANETGTHFVEAFFAADVEHAKRLAIAECAKCWNYDKDSLEILGVCKGEVQLIEWNEGKA